MTQAVVYIQENRGHILSVSTQLAAKARALCHNVTGVAIVAQNYLDVFLETVPALGLDQIYIFKLPENTPFYPETHLEAVSVCLQDLSPEVLLFGATLEGRMLAPMVGAVFKTGVTADCTDLSVEEGFLIQTRPAFGGRVMASIRTAKTRPQIATVRPGIFSTEGLKVTFPDVIYRDLSLQKPAGITFLKESIQAAEKDQSPVIIAVGGGLREKSDLVLFENLAHKMDAALMCSRALVERGWLAQDFQIGLSGQTVAPKILYTFGISGSVQFMSGIHGTKTICAVNADPKAAILKEADVPVEGDLYAVAEAMLQEEI